LPPPINLANLSTIPKRQTASDEKILIEGKRNIPKAPPLVFQPYEKKVVKTEIKKEVVKEPKVESVNTI